MKKALSFLLACMMLIALLPVNAIAEEVESVTSEPIATESEPKQAESSEPAEESVADPTEEPATEPTEEPVADLTVEPAAEPTMEPETKSTKSGDVVDSGETGDCTWTITGEEDNYTLTVSGNGAMPDYDWDENPAPWWDYYPIVNIEIVNGVTNIGNLAFSDQCDLTSVTIPDSVTSIGDSAFICCCSNLETVIIPDSVISIGESAFTACSSLTTITIPEGVTSIGEGTFDGCSSLTEIVVDENNTAYSSNDGVLFTKDGTTLLKCPAKKTGACSIPNGVLSIEPHAFSSCSSLTSITLPEGLESIGSYAFSYCKSLISIMIPENVASVGDRVFYGCTSLETVIIPDSVISIGESAFSSCSSLTSITLPEGLESIGSYAFSYCKSLISIMIPENVASVGDRVFYGCTSLTEIVVDEDNTVYSSVDGVLFSKDGTILICCPAGKTGVYEIPQGVTKVNAYAFANTKLSEIIFYGTSGEWRKFGCSVPSGTKLTIVAPKTGTTGACTWTITGEEGNYTLTISGEGEMGGSEEVWYDYEITQIVIEAGVTNISDYAFAYNSSLTTVTISNTVLSIGEGAFEDCYSLSSILIPDSVTSIGDGVFGGCTSLIEINVEDGNANYASFEGVLFNKDMTTLICCPDAKTGIYSVPSGVTSIGYAAFASCDSLTSITIPNSVTSIERYAFEDCSSLTEITLPFVGNGSDETHFGYLFGARTYSYNGSYVPKNLKKVIITGSTSIASYAFYNCKSLTSIAIPNSVTSIERYAFEDCSSLTEITLPFVGNGSDETHFGYIFGASTYSYNGSYVPNSLETVTVTGGGIINSYAFCFCDDLTTIILSDDITEIMQYAFCCCSSLTTVVLPDHEVGFEEYVFSRCSSLTTITLPEGINYINEGMFTACTSLIEITIPESVVEIDLWAFEDCKALTSITIPQNVEKIDNAAFRGCTSLSEIIVDENNTTYSSVDGVLFTKDCTTLILCPEGKTGIFTIPQGVTVVNSSAFTNTKLGEIIFYGTTAEWNSLGCTIPSGTKVTIVVPKTGMTGDCFWEITGEEGNYTLTIYGEGEMGEYASEGSAPWLDYSAGITAISIGDGVTSVGNYAFSKCTALTSVTVANSVTSIGENAFSDCTSLTEITIPEGVTSIGDSVFSNCHSLTSIALPKTLESIGDYAFSYCSSLTSITIPDGVTSIGNSAFSSCSSLTEITIPEGVTSIGDSVFSNCHSLTSIALPKTLESIGNHAFSGCSSLKSVTIPNSVTSIGYSIFGRCSSLAEITIPFVGNGSDQTNFGYIFGARSFWDNNYDVPKSLKKVTITGGESIGDSAFSYCSSLTSITIPDSVTSIGNRAFYNCSSLPSITIPDSVTSIGNSAFGNCSALTEITLPFVGNGSDQTHFGYIFGAWSYYDNSSYVPKSLKKVTLTGGKSIADYAFSDCVSLASITIPASVTEISTKAFWDCTALVEIVVDANNTVYSSVDGVLFSKDGTTLCLCPQGKTGAYSIPEGTVSIGGEAFYSCTSLTSITIPNSVTSIERYAFQNCSSLTEITLPFVGNGSDETHFGYIFGASTYSYNGSYVPKSLKTVIITGGESIAEDAFYGCSSLKSVTIPNSVTSVGYRAFYYCSSLPSITIPASVTEISTKAFWGCTALVEIVVDANNTVYSSVDGVLFSKDGTTLCLCPQGKTGAYSIPEGTVSIGGEAFYSCTSLTSITIPEGTVHIGREAFCSCKSLTGITIPGSVTSTGDYAFHSCTSLTSVTIEEGVTEIGEFSFDSCSSLTTITLPESLTHICNGAFESTSLTSITVPKGVKSIGTYVFRYCRSLRELTLPFAGNGSNQTHFGYIYGSHSAYWPSELDKVTLTVVSPAKDAFYGMSISEFVWQIPDCASVNVSAFPDNCTIERFVIGNMVDSIAANVFSIDAGAFAFEGENHFRLLGNVSNTALDKPLSELTEGDYYVDEYGALYKIVGNVASFVYCPTSLETYTILAEIPSEDGSKNYPVRSVSSYSLASADALDSLTIENPAVILSLDSYAFAYCPTLESINGKTTKQEAFALFTSLTIWGNDLFLETGLEGEEPTDDEVDSNAVTEPIEVISSGVEVVVTTHLNSGKVDENMKGQHRYYTGETCLTNVAISKPDNSTVDEIVRIYLVFETDWHLPSEGILSLTPGEHAFILGNGNEITVSSGVLSDKVYYLEIPALKPGETFNFNFTTVLPSGTAGGKVRIFPSVSASMQKRSLQTIHIGSEEYHEVEWITKQKEFSLTKAFTSGKLVPAEIVTTGINAKLDTTKYTITYKKSDSMNLGSLGADYVQAVTFTDKLTLPEGMNWSEEILSSGEIGIGNYNGYGVLRFGASAEFARISENVNGASIRINSAEIDSDGNLLVTWTLKNDDLATEIPDVNMVFQISSGAIVLATETPKDSYILRNDVTATIEFSFADPEELIAFDEKEFNVTEKNLLINYRDRNKNHYYGAADYYDIELTNDKLMPFDNITELTELMTDFMYLPSNEMKGMFDADTDHLLSVEIANATLCESIGTDGSITVTDCGGNEIVNGPNQTGSHTSYDAASSEDPCMVTDEATLRIYWNEQGVLEMSVKIGSDEYIASIGNNDIEATLRHFEIDGVDSALAYHVTKNARYKITWTFADPLTLYGGETKTFFVPCHIKDTFMLLEKDAFLFRTDKQEGTKQRYATVYYKESEESKTKSKYASQWLINPDISLNGELKILAGIVTGEERDPSVVNDQDLLSFKILLEQSQNMGGDYAGLPVIAWSCGALVAMVPAAFNPHLGEAPYGLEVETIYGQECYVLAKTGTYENVSFIEGVVADSVTVSELPEGGLENLIKWYTTDLRADTVYQFVYYMMMDFERTGAAYFENMSWLNDHETHRIYVGCGSKFHKIIPEKDIVTTRGETPEKDNLDEDKHSIITENDAVTYRLTIEAIHNRTFTLTAGDLYDALPFFDKTHQWSAEHIQVEFVADANCTVVNGNSWIVTSETPEGATKADGAQYLVWDEEFKLDFATVDNDDGITYVYIYVTLQYPKGEEWQVCANNAHKIIVNEFNADGVSSTVTHDIGAKTKAILQKGVYATGILQSSTNYLSSEENSRLFYANSDSKERSVIYYAILYNEGPTRLYLNPIQDVLPKGFTLAADAYNAIAKLPSQANLKPTVVNTDGGTVSPKYFTDIKVAWEKSTTESGQQHLTFTITSPTMGYDSRYEKYYLNPGEAIVFAYCCKVDSNVDNTDPVANNLIAMPFFDYCDGGIELSGHTITGAKRNDITRNDGTNYLLNNAGATDKGLQKYEDSTDWLASDVDLSRGMIEPGIQKEILKCTSPAGIVTESPTVAGTCDILDWKIAVSNEGQLAIRNYTVTDVMQTPYIFTSDLKLKLYAGPQFSNSVTAISKTILTFGEAEFDAETGLLASIAVGSQKLVVNGSALSMDDGNILVSLKRDTQNNNILVIELPTDKYAIGPGGYCEFYVSTVVTNVHNNTIYYNNTYLTPTQPFELVDAGKLATYNDRLSVQDFAAITVSYGYATTSVVEVIQSGNAENHADSNNEPNGKNYIVIPTDVSSGTVQIADTFRYKLTINNITDYGMDKLVFITNLPEPNDHATFVDHVERNSTFRVDFAEDPQLQVVVTLEDGSTVELTEDQYAVMYSEKTSFGNKDWSASDEEGNAGWTETPTADSRSLRVVILDETAKLMPTDSDISVIFTATVDPEEKIDTTSQAWINFGYRYSLERDGSELESSPLNVGVIVAGSPTLKKVLENDEQIQDENMNRTFRILVYSGAGLNLADKSEAEIAKALKDNNRLFTVVEVEADADAISLGMLKRFTYKAEDGWVETDDAFVWNHDEAYTVLELPHEAEYIYYVSMNGNTKAEYTFVYDEVKNQAIVCVNEFAVIGNAELVLNGTKVLEGRELADGEFEFELYEADAQHNMAAEPIRTVTHANGAFAFTLLYNAEDLGKTFHYVVREKKAGETENGITYTSQVYYVEVKVKHDGGRGIMANADISNGNIAVEGLHFINTYRPTPLSISFDGKKTVNGNYPISEGDYLFELYETDAEFRVTDEPIQTATNDGEGIFAFTELTAEEARTYYYVIRENADDPIENVEYDKGEYRITVTVFDNGQGNLQIGSESIVHIDGETEEAADEIAFENTYNAPDPTPMSISFGGKKVINGIRTIHAGEFLFELYETDANFGVTAEPIRTAKVDGAGGFTFESITLEMPGTYYYVIRENADDPIENMEYDKGEYRITVTVSDDGQGNLQIESESILRVDGEIEEAADEIIFENIYYAPEPPPKTGDPTKLGLWLALLAISSVSLATLALCRRRRQDIV